MVMYSFFPLSFFYVIQQVPPLSGYIVNNSLLLATIKLQLSFATYILLLRAPKLLNGPFSTQHVKILRTETQGSVWRSMGSMYSS